jgi:hypothetical protein
VRHRKWINVFWIGLAVAVATAACGSRNIGGLDVEPGVSGSGGVGGAGGSGGVAGTGGWAGYGGVVAGTGGTAGYGGWTEYGGWAGYGGVVAGTGGTAGYGGVAAGAGGWTEYGGSAGAGGVIPSCVPGFSVACACATGALGSQTCRRDGTFGPCTCADAGSWEQQELARIRAGVIGTWKGLQTNPWNGVCETKITFEADGHYGAHSPDDMCVVFYYGTNDDSPEKTYLFDDVQADGDGSGEIQIYFGPNDTVRGEMRHVWLSPDARALTFECWRGDYGPLMFKLERAL